MVSLKPNTPPTRRRDSARQLRRVAYWAWTHTACVYNMERMQGDVVSVIRRLDENWFEGLHDGRQGLLPAAYVELIRSPLPPSSPHYTASITGTAKSAHSTDQKRFNRMKKTHENNCCSDVFIRFVWFPIYFILKQDNVRSNTESVQCRDFFSREPIPRPNIPRSRLTLHRRHRSCDQSIRHGPVTKAG